MPWPHGIRTDPEEKVSPRTTRTKGLPEQTVRLEQEAQQPPGSGRRNLGESENPFRNMLSPKQRLLPEPGEPFIQVTRPGWPLDGLEKWRGHWGEGDGLM